VPRPADPGLARPPQGRDALIKLTAGTIVDLARDPRWLGATPGVLAVLHTWTQRLVFHPHVRIPMNSAGDSG
jgi:hypothetical protein